MKPLAFSVNWDYRCPFARIVHEHVITALEGGADWEVQFVPFCLNQVHLEEGEPAVWDNPERAPDRLALEVGIAVRDRLPERFLAVHRALFDARHELGGDLRDEGVVRAALQTAGFDAAEVDKVFGFVRDGWPRETLRAEHEKSVAEHAAFGVPTFMVDGQAAFVRIMERANGDAVRATETIERVVRLLTEHPELNELKHTTIRR